MASTISEEAGLYIRPIKELWLMWAPRVRAKGYPFNYASYEDMETVMKSLTSYDRDKWAAAFSAVAKPYEEKAAQAEKSGDVKNALENYLKAYQYYHIARFPTINSEGKRAAYRKSQEMFLKAAKYFDPPLQRIEIPFKGKPGEGDKIPVYLRLPKKGAAPFPVLLTWGGIDGFKEDQSNEPALAHGIVHLMMDGPGAGDSPVRGSEDAERIFDVVFDWIANQKNLNSKKVAVWGQSTGGYWATKVAHVFKDRVACAVSHGGPSHYSFQPDWMKTQERGEYAFEVFDTLCYTFGQPSYKAWVEFAPKLSLLTQGILDRPCAPLLLVNGLHDTLFTIKDYYLLLEHGSPKTARFYDVGHMGYTKDTFDTIMNWIYERLA